MKMPNKIFKRSFLSAFGFAIALVSLLYYFFAKAVDSAEIPFSSSPAMNAMAAAPELSGNIVLRQVIVPGAFKRTVGSEADTVCIKIFMANYSNRSNSGDVRVTLTLDGVNFFQRIDAAHVKDNAFHGICFEQAKARQLFNAKDVKLTMLGVSPPGRAVTAWTAADVRSGYLVSSRDRPSERSLIYYFFARRLANNVLVNYIAFISLGIVAILCIFLTPWNLKRGAV